MKANRDEVALENVFRALSDRTRLRILNLLQKGELCVCDLTSVLDVPQPTASRHLAYLRKAGLVLARKEGLWHYYRLAKCQSNFHAALMNCLATCECVDCELEADLKQLKKPNCKGC